MQTSARAQQNTARETPPQGTGLILRCAVFVQRGQAHLLKCPPSTTMRVDRPLIKGVTTARKRPHLKAGRVGQEKTSTQIQVWNKRGQAHRLKCPTSTTMRVDQPKNNRATSSHLGAYSNTNTLHTTGCSKIQRYQASPRTEVNGKSGPVGQTNQQYLGHNFQRSILHQQHLRLSTLTMSRMATNFTRSNRSKKGRTWYKPVHWLANPSKSAD